MVLNAAARMVVGIGKYEQHITPVLRDTLHWLPVTARIRFKIAALTFDCVRGTGPVYFKQVIRPVSDLSRRSLRSADRGDLFVSPANTSIGQRSFSVAAPVVWNTLPPDLRSPLNSRRQFRSKLKTHLFQQAYNTAWFLWEQFVEECNSVTVAVWHTVVHHSSTPIYVPNVMEIGRKIVRSHLNFLPSSKSRTQKLGQISKILADQI